MAISLAGPYGPGRAESELQRQSLGFHPLTQPTTPGGYDSSGINPGGTMYTGGNHPAIPVPGTSTGGNLPPTQKPAIPMPPPLSGNTPPVSASNGGIPPVLPGLPPASNSSGALPPPVPGVPAPANGFDINSILQDLWGATGGAGTQANPATLANQYMASLLSADNPYIRDARTRGMEMANARGLSNSSIAAGSAERSAIEAAQPMFQAAYGLNQQRENNTFQGALDRFNQGMNLLGQREQNAFVGQQHAGDLNWQAQQAQFDRDLKSKLQSDAAFQQNWLSSQDFSRQFNAALSMMPINTASQFMQTIQQYAIENPEIYTPEMISGMQNFFTQSMSQLLKQFFPSLGGK